MAKRELNRGRTLPNMCAQLVWDHPAYVALPCAGRGMLWALLEHWWRSDCRPRPKDEDQLFGVMRAHRPTFRVYKTLILSIFDEVAPKIERDMRWRQGARVKLAERGREGAAKRAATAATARIEKSFPTTASASAGLLPVKDRAPEAPQPRTITPKPHDTKSTRGGTFRDRPR